MAYQKNIWQTGDIITAEKLNNIEEGIDNVTELGQNDYFVSTIFPSIYMQILNLESDNTSFNKTIKFENVPEEELLKISKIKNFQVNMNNQTGDEVTFCFNLLSQTKNNTTNSFSKLYSYVEMSFTNFYFLQLTFDSIFPALVEVIVTKIDRTEGRQNVT